MTLGQFWETLQLRSYSGKASRVLAVSSLLTLLSACDLSRFVSSEGETGVFDPERIQSRETALGLFNGAIVAFREAFAGSPAQGGVVRLTSMFTDEMMSGVVFGVPTLPSAATAPTILQQTNEIYQVHTRRFPDDKKLVRQMQEAVFRRLNLTRNQSADAIHAIRTYTSNLPPDLIGHMHSIRGWSMIYLAEVFCSGIPLTEYKGGGGFTYAPPVTSDSVYKLAVVQFDSALALFKDSINYQQFASLGKGRALLNLGQYGQAANAVKDVQTGYVFANPYAPSGASSLISTVWSSQNTNPELLIGTPGDRKGINGLPYSSSNDPRIPLVNHPRQHATYPTVYKIPAWLFPKGSPWNGISDRPYNAQLFVVSNGIAARLIEVENQLNSGGGDWLSALNALRTNGVSEYDTTLIINDNGMDGIDTVKVIDTVWKAGAGNVVGLAPLADPGTREDRIKLLYSERAYWLYFTGNRQGDLRRMVRQYGFKQEEVYPTGPVAVEPFRTYGDEVNIPVPYSEDRINPEYNGCLNRDA